MGYPIQVRIRGTGADTDAGETALFSGGELYDCIRQERDGLHYEPDVGENRSIGDVQYEEFRYADAEVSKTPHLRTTRRCGVFSAPDFIPVTDPRVSPAPSVSRPPGLSVPSCAR